MCEGWYGGFVEGVGVVINFRYKRLEAEYLTIN